MAAPQRDLPLAVAEPGWRRPRLAPSLAEVYRTVPVSTGAWWRKALAFAGPGYLVAVGYMDPGNWATDLAGGSRFGYALLSVILLSNLMAILLQGLAAKLGIAPGHDAEFRGQPLQQDRHQVGQQDDRKQRVPEARAAREIGGPVAGIHVPHGHEVARSRERQRLAPPRTRADGNGAIDFGEARRETRAPPSRLCYGERKIALWRRHQ